MCVGGVFGNYSMKKIFKQKTLQKTDMDKWKNYSKKRTIQQPRKNSQEKLQNRLELEKKKTSNWVPPQIGTKMYDYKSLYM